MKHIVKITKYKHRCSINIPIDIVKAQGLEKYKYMVVERDRFGHITMKGYKDDEEKE